MVSRELYRDTKFAASLQDFLYQTKLELLNSFAAFDGYCKGPTIF